MRRLFMLLGLLAALGVVSVGDAQADCARVHVWVNYEDAPSDDVADECPWTPFPTAFDVHKDTKQTDTVPPGQPNGAGVYVSVPLPEPWAMLD